MQNGIKQMWTVSLLMEIGELLDDDFNYTYYIDEDIKLYDTDEGLPFAILRETDRDMGAKLLYLDMDKRFSKGVTDKLNQLFEMYTYS